MKPPTPGASAFIDEAKQFAALSGMFAPIDAVPPGARDDPAVLAVVASALSAVCDTNPDESGHWLIRTSARRTMIEHLAASDALPQAVEERQAAATDQDTQDLLGALLGSGSFAPAAIAADLASASPDRARVAAIVTALDRAGDVAPAYGHLVQARSLLAGFDRRERRAAIDSRGFFGRIDEIARLTAWLETPFTAPPVQTALLSGLPGIGKSALLEKMVGLAFDRYNGITVRLDFDRAGLNVVDLLPLTMEVARQVADRLGDAGAELVAARLAAGKVEGGTSNFASTVTKGFPIELAAAIGRAVAASGRPVLLVLDTLEVLRARGNEHPRELFAWIDALVGAGLRPLRILSAGRGDALDTCPERIGRPEPLAGLDAAAAAALLDKLGAPAEARDRIMEIAEGNPLVLRLATDVVLGFGVGELPQERLSADVTAAFLYRFLLSRIDDKTLCQLANPGLIARRLSPDFMREVLAKTLGIEMTAEQAKVHFDALAAQHWLVERDPAEPEFVRHRSDMRRVLLPLLYREEAAQCAQINAAAAKWFAKRPGAEAEVDAAYHALQSMTATTKPPKLTSAVAQRFDEQLIAELPQAAQDMVRQAAGGRSSKFRGAPKMAVAADDPGAVSELVNLIERQDWAEGQYVVDQIASTQSFDPSGQVAAAIATFRWYAGQWADARKLLRARYKTSAGPEDIDRLPLPLAIARLEMLGEFDPQRLTRLLRGASVEPLIEAAQRLPVSLARQGALGFQLAAMDRSLESVWAEKEADVVAAAFELWAGRSGHGQAAFAFRICRERLATRNGGVDIKTGWNNPQLLAMLSPYAPFAANLARQRANSWLDDAARGAEARLLAEGALFIPPISGIAPMPSSPVAGIAGVGLFAEWAEATGFLRRDANLRAIGRAAERWRRTMAGDWSYRPAPADWPAERGVDPVIWKRIEALETRADAVSQLALWSEDADGEQVWKVLQKRYAASLRAAETMSDPAARARCLLDRHVPAAFVPALVHLIEVKPVYDPPLVNLRRSLSVQEQVMTNARRDESLKRLMTPEVNAAIHAMIENRSLPRGITDMLATTALEAVRSGSAPLESVGNSAALEAIVRRVGRPPLVVRGDVVELEPLPGFEPGTDIAIKRNEIWVKSVGRVEFVNADTPWGGTGWVIEHKDGAAIIATNRHVAKIVAKRLADGRAVFMRALSGARYGANIDFGEEAGSASGDTSRTLAVASLKYLADDLSADVALLRVEAAAALLPSPIPLAATPAKPNDLVALIGYPASDIGRNNADDQARYFRDLYDVKRFAPGFVMQALSGTTLLTHDCTSLGGNSGSPLIRLSDSAVVGLHFAGEYGVGNSAVGVDTLKALLAGNLVQVPVGAEGRAETIGDGHHTSDFFNGRMGFDTQFLGDGTISTPWPKLQPDANDGLAVPSDAPVEPNELRYTHFGVKYSRVEKLPLMTAVNIDGAKSVRVKRGNDQWFTDGRIALADQLRAANFADAEIDRGHMVRREDPNWGPVAEVANFDTFHYVNAAPQHAKLNQGKQLWQGLENYILDSSRTGGFQACVFTGPILSDEDPVIDAARVPMQYWKLVATLDAAGKALRATAYLLSQGQLIRDLLEKRSRTEAMEGVVLGAYRTFQLAVADLALATGHDFSAYLAADPLARLDSSTEAAALDAPRFITLDAATDIVL